MTNLTPMTPIWLLLSLGLFVPGILRTASPIPALPSNGKQPQ